MILRQSSMMEYFSQYSGYSEETLISWFTAIVIFHRTFDILYLASVIQLTA